MPLTQKPVGVNNPYIIEKELKAMIKDVKSYYHTGGVYEKLILTQDLFKNKMEKKYKYLNESSIGLFNKCLINSFRDNANLIKINEMINHLKNIYNGHIDRETVDKELGKQYAKEYVDPLVS
jgi:hypothetical protein